MFGTFTFASVAGAATSEPFAVMLSGSQYASVAPLSGAYDETRPQTFARDPGCPANAHITVDDGATTETHAFACSGGQFAAN